MTWTLASGLVARCHSISQRRDRIDPRRQAGRNVARHRSDTTQDGGCRGDRGWIDGAAAEPKRAQQPGHV
jgi:hypothetical protein